MPNGRRIELELRENRTPGKPEWSLPCGCAFHIFVPMNFPRENDPQTIEDWRKPRHRPT